MPVNVFGEGPVQTAYVSYIAYPNFDADLILFWPSTYTTSPNILAASNNFTPQTTGLTVTLPDANQVSLGMNALITNSGTTSFTLLDNAGNTVSTINPSITYFIQLTGYTSDSGGVWSVIVQGAGTSSADAAALAGLGLTALGSPLKLNTNIPIKTANSGFTLQPSDRAALYILSGGTYTVMCPDDGTTTIPSGFSVSFNNTGTGTVTFVGVNGTALFNGQPNLLLDPKQTVTLDYDGTNYWSLGLGNITPFQTDTNNFDVVSVQTGGNLTLSLAENNKYLQQYFCSGGNITGNIVIYLQAIANTWYISNFCSSTNSSTLSVCLGTPNAPQGIPLQIPNGEKLIVYAAKANGTGTLQLYNTPTIITPSSVQFPNGTVSAPGIAFQNDPSSGMYLNALYFPTIASHGSDIVQFDGSASNAVQLLANPNATGSNFPTYAFIGSRVSGMGLSSGSASLDFYLGGTKRFNYSAASGFNVLAGLTTLASGGLTVPGPTLITGGTGTLGVEGLSTLTGGLTTPGNIVTTGTGSINIGGTGTLTVAGLSTLTGGFVSSANSSVTGTFTVNTGLTTLNAGLTVTGTTTLNTPLSIGNGGTGQSSRASAINALLPTASNGQMIYFNGTDWVVTSFSGPLTNGDLLMWNGSGWVDGLSNALQTGSMLYFDGTKWHPIAVPGGASTTYNLELTTNGAGGFVALDWV